MKKIDGNAISREIIEELKIDVANLEGPKPCVAFIRVGEDPASVVYVNKKKKIAEEIGIESRLILLDDKISESDLICEVDRLNNDSSVHGFLIQTPLPNHINDTIILNRVNPEKDIDGFSYANLGRLCQENPDSFIACTPAGIIEILQRTNVKTEGKHVVIIGRSLIVGKPCSLLFLRRHLMGNATVTVCHSKTADLASITKQADILIAAIGKPNFVTVDMVKKNAVIIDVGINRIKDDSKKSGYRLVGDVDFLNVEPVVDKITPVPGGVGPMTVAMLMSNTVKAYKNSRN